MEQIRVAVLTKDTYCQAQMEDVLRRIHAVSLVPNAICEDTDEEGLKSFLELQAPWVVFIDARNMPGAVSLANRIAKLARGTQLVAVGADKDPDTVMQAMRGGMREFLTFPISTDETLEALARLRALLRENPPAGGFHQQMISFLPAKPGVGASTLCVNVAAALARVPGVSVGLLDFDLHCSVLEFLLKMPEGYTLYDAASRANHMDDDLWRRMVRTAHGMDILPSGRQPETAKSCGADLQVTQLISQARKQYQAVCMDLPGQFDACSLEVMRNSNRYLLVSTSELASLYSARQAVRILDEIGLASRIDVVLNRIEPRAILSTSQMEDVIGRKIFLTLPNDYAGVQKAVKEGSPLTPQSMLGSRYTEIAGKILGIETMPTQSSKPRTFFGLLGAKSATRTLETAR